MSKHLKVRVIATREEHTLESQVNEFIQGKDVQDIQYSASYNGASPISYYSITFSAMITYYE
ncbi:MAG: hypothetical protein ACRDB2_03185 [Fusobacteriaceae bacterium]